MSRRISVFIARAKDWNDRPAIINITYYIATLFDKKRNKNDGGITMGGCGYDAGYEIVERLDFYLFGKRDGRDRLRHEWL